MLMLLVSSVYAQENNGKVVLITGTASGIGKATAERLIEQGYIVYGGDIQYEKNRYLDKIGGHSLDMDVTNEKQIVDSVAKVIKEQGRIDVLVNNAGYGLFGAVEEVTLEDARAQFDVNLFGLARVTQEVLPIMRKQQDGTIINISSMGGKIYGPLGAWYHASKHAVEGLSDSLRLEVKKFGIDVVIVQPGLINTAFGATAGKYMAKYSQGTAYQHMYDIYMNPGNVPKTRDYDRDARSPSEASVIAKVIEKAIEAEQPLTRYVKGAAAHELMHKRLMLSDEQFDELMMGGY